MAEHITIGDRLYRVESGVMGVQLGLLEYYDGEIPQRMGVKDWMLLLQLSIFYGEQMDGRESDFDIASLLTMNSADGLRIINDFQAIYNRQNPTKKDNKKKA